MKRIFPAFSALTLTPNICFIKYPKTIIFTAPISFSSLKWRFSGLINLFSCKFSPYEGKKGPQRLLCQCLIRSSISKTLGRGLISCYCCCKSSCVYFGDLLILVFDFNYIYLFILGGILLFFFQVIFFSLVIKSDFNCGLNWITDWLIIKKSRPRTLFAVSFFLLPLKRLSTILFHVFIRF